MTSPPRDTSPCTCFNETLSKQTTLIYEHPPAKMFIKSFVCRVVKAPNEFAKHESMKSAPGSFLIKTLYLSFTCLLPHWSEMFCKFLVECNPVWWRQRKEAQGRVLHEGLQGFMPQFFTLVFSFHSLLSEGKAQSRIAAFIIREMRDKSQMFSSNFLWLKNIDTKI